jgi:aminoglycoside 6'-N-acetyltransferase I
MFLPRRGNPDEVSHKTMDIVPATIDDIDAWAELRAALWPEGSVEHHRDELVQSLRVVDRREVAFLARAASGEIVGFAEATLRSDYVNGCDTSPVAFLEGIYVRPVDRRKGVARSLVRAVEAWGRERGCSELASDALIDNTQSHAFHAAAGFEETDRVVYFRKPL